MPGSNDQSVAALFVERHGCYYGLPDVDPWDEKRDARLYNGPWPVVAHPPCTRWCRLAGLIEARWGHKRGEDGGCFESALRSVRTWGGVLEHPAYTDAWEAFGLERPPKDGGWVSAGDCGGYTCHVEQGRYGTASRQVDLMGYIEPRPKKATWLYAYGCNLPALRWGAAPDNASTALVSWCGNHTKAHDKRRRVGKHAAAATPIAFRDVLISMARSCYAKDRPAAAKAPNPAP